jgi:hypothetical protein
MFATRWMTSRPIAVSDPHALATTVTSAFVDDLTKLYLGFFYGSAWWNVAAHWFTSRHYDVGHDANFLPWSDLAGAGEGQQADSSWEYNGAYRVGGGVSFLVQLGGGSCDPGHCATGRGNAPTGSSITRWPSIRVSPSAPAHSRSRPGVGATNARGLRG